MPELGCKVSVPWICPQGKHLCLFLALLGFFFNAQSFNFVVLKPSWLHREYYMRACARAFVYCADSFAKRDIDWTSTSSSWLHFLVSITSESHLNNDYIIHPATCLSPSLVIYNQDIKEADIFWNKSNKHTDLIFCLTHAALSTEGMMSRFCQCGLMVTHLLRGVVPVTGGTFVTSGFCL